LLADECQDKLDVMIVIVVLVSLIPAAFEWWRHRREVSVRYNGRHGDAQGW
jgi:hypothetical protein